MTGPKTPTDGAPDTPLTAEQKARIEAALARHAGREGPLLPILHDLQHAFGHIPKAAVPLVAEALNLTRAEVHGVVTFYADFRAAQTGRRLVQVCVAEACQARGADRAVMDLSEGLRVALGETTPDGALTFEPIFCLGLCATGPAALVDGEPVSRLTGWRIQALCEALRP